MAAPQSNPILPDGAGGDGVRDRALPSSLLYSIAAGIGGTGLDQVAAESLAAAARGEFLGKAVAYSCRAPEIPRDRVELLAFHPVKLLSFLPRENYVGAKKQALDGRAAALLKSGRYDLFHSWSGDCLASLEMANRFGIPSVLEIPTWHRNKGKVKKDKTWSEIQRDAAPFPKSVLNRLLVTRQRVMEEYARADLLLVLSEKAKETFVAAGVPEEKLFLTTRGVDVDRFTPGERPANFRAIFVGSLIKRKGVHHLLDVWKRLALPHAELVLAGSPSREIEPWLRDAPGNVRVLGFVEDVAAELRRATAHVFPSECEGSAKSTYEAAACALPQISTREAGDVVVDGENGIIVPPNDPDALAAALEKLHSDPSLAARMGEAGRRRAVEHFTWDRFRERLLDAYRVARARRSPSPIRP